MSSEYILNKLSGLLGIISFPETPEERDAAENELRAEIARLIAAVDAVSGLAQKWETEAGPDSEARRIFGKQVVSVEFAVEKIRETIAAALERQ